MPLKPKSLTTQSSKLQPPKPPSYHRLTSDKIQTILRLHEAGQNQSQIAAIVKVDHTTVGDALHQWLDVRELAKRIPQQRAIDLMDAAVDGAILAAREDHLPEAAIGLLKTIAVLPKDQVADQRSLVQIVVGGPEQPRPACLPGHVLSVSPLVTGATRHSD